MNAKERIASDGFAVINDVFTVEEVNNILKVISEADTDKSTFRKTNDLFAIRQFFKEIPSIVDLVFIDNLTNIIADI